MKMIGLLVLFALLCSSQVSAKYEPNWDSLDSRPVPEWYDDAKFGIFLHWGVYAVPGAGSEWFWIQWKDGNEFFQDFVSRTQAPDFTYQTYAHQLTAEFFDASQWARIFKRSGAKYVVLTSKHHEGYTLWPSSKAFSWNSVEVGPHRDIVRELSDAVKAEDLKFGTYYSLFEWYNPIYLADKNADYKTRNYVTEKMLPEMTELIMNYEPDLLWTDGEWEASDDYWLAKEFLAWLYNESPVKDKVVTYDRWGTDLLCKRGGVYTCMDRFNPQVLQKHKWENCMTVDKSSWGYRKIMNLEDVLSTEELIFQLVTTVSCGGNVLLNVGPTQEGTIVSIFQERLISIGDWLSINGEAIYETKPWKNQNDTINNDVWYTASKKDSNVIYGTLVKWPQSNSVQVASLKLTENKSTIHMLGYEEPLKWATKNDITTIELPNLALVPSKIAWSMKIALK